MDSRHAVQEFQIGGTSSALGASHVDCLRATSVTWVNAHAVGVAGVQNKTAHFDVAQRRESKCHEFDTM
jgi:hypothetical protein